MKRLDRPGQERPVLPVNLVTAGTIDVGRYSGIQKEEDWIDTLRRLVQSSGRPDFSLDMVGTRL